MEVQNEWQHRPWLDHAFEFAVDKAAALDGCLKFKIKKAKRIFCLKKDVGEVDVPVRDLLVNGGAGDGNVKPKVLSCEVRSSSRETKAVLKFSYQFSKRFPIKRPTSDERRRDTHRLSSCTGAASHVLATNTWGSAVLSDVATGISAEGMSAAEAISATGRISARACPPLRAYLPYPPGAYVPNATPT
ncbi:hypothetical protein NL676_030588 [Syzygium grande]|nr:hypothetical protein NL676_030588 [Syzygium grande]